MLAAFNPLHQCVELVRAAVLYGFEWNDLLRVGYPRPVRPDHVADRDSRHGTEADRLSEPEYRVEPWGEDDLPLLHRLLGDPAMMEHLGGP